ncbi:helix-turn-helix transcriptional regulator [Neobacillus sp. PS3-12]|jgi:transcriptional regulator with XRE-family HTH domain|uniref:helix-turn-helix domain-containing protein n=1 Tax=Neobacillus sp. PS3-12 TaxID=3070677 RepID=UPI0027DFB70F|nr:helix-turn-helix transcriptional regulator [Neobacillus sp. PS3-12]WML54592.1 helix-turn-helix transcriptional regulator [Neobacillus sp. PS3-12]
MSSLGENIKTIRERRNMSQEELAQKLRIGAKKIDDYESGRQVPSNETLLKISTVLDIPTSQLTSVPS